MPLQIQDELLEYMFDEVLSDNEAFSDDEVFSDDSDNEFEVKNEIIEESVIEEPVIDEQTDIKFVGFTIPRIETYQNAKGEEKKKPIGMIQKWTDIITAENYENYINPNHEVRCLITGQKSNIIVIDFDDIESYEKIKSDFPDITKHKTIKTRRGFHIYCK